MPRCTSLKKKKQASPKQIDFPINKHSFLKSLSNCSLFGRPWWWLKQVGGVLTTVLSVAGFPFPCFHAHLWVLHQKRVMGTWKNLGNKIMQFAKRVFTLAGGCCFFLLVWKKSKCANWGHLPNNLSRSERWTRVLAVYADDVFLVSSYLAATRLDMFHSSYSHRYVWTTLPACMLPGRLLILLLVCNLYFFCILLQPRYGTLPILPSTDKIVQFATLWKCT